MRAPFHIQVYVHFTIHHLLSVLCRCVNSDTNSASFGRIQPHCNYFTKTIQLHISTTAYSQSFMQLRELGSCGENENAQSSKQHQWRFEPGPSRLRIPHSSADLPRSTSGNSTHWCFHPVSFHVFGHFVFSGTLQASRPSSSRKLSIRFSFLLASYMS